MRLLTSLLLAATIVFLFACGRPSDPTSEVNELPVSYVGVGFSEIDSAKKLATRCGQVRDQARGQLATLEAYDGEPTIEGYYESLDSLFSSFETFANVAQAMSQLHPSAALRDEGEACARELAKVRTDLSLSRPIYDRVNRIDAAGVDPVTRYSIDKVLLQFRLSGVDKDLATRDRIRELSGAIVATGQEFDRNIRDDVRYLELDSVDDLAGLPDDYIAAHEPDEHGVIRISTQYPDVLPFLEYAEGDKLRREMHTLFSSRAFPQNEPVLRRLIEARHELATLIGFDNFADMITADRMVRTPGRVAQFIEELKGFTADVQDSEYEALLARLRLEQPDAEQLQRWQASFVRSKVRREQYDVDSKLVRQYFNYEASRDGILSLIEDLFALRIEPWDTETWHEDVQSFSLYDGDELVEHFYLDMHPREGKFQHAAMFPLITGVEEMQLPVGILACNFPRGRDPMQQSQVLTFLHEFGHLVHWLSAGHHRWSNVVIPQWDFVEAPSQMLEEWIWNYETVSKFARNADGELLPRDLHERMLAARDFGLGMTTRRQLSLAALSLRMYSTPPDGIDFDALERGVTTEFTRFEPVDGAHEWAGFWHLNSYSATYYAYQWSLAIAMDIFTRFKEAGLRNVEVARSYRDKVLVNGGNRPAEDAVTEFLGRPIDFGAYAERLRGAGAGD